MNQKVNDIYDTVKNDRKWVAIGLFGVVSFVLAFFLSGGKSKPSSNRAPESQHSPAFEEKVISRDSADVQVSQMVESLRRDLLNQQKITEGQASVIARMDKDKQLAEQNIEAVLSSLVGRVEELQQTMNILEQEKAAASEAGSSGQKGMISTIPSAVELEPLVPEQEIVTSLPPPPPPRPIKVSVISPGDSVEAELLTGVEAPTDGTPYPVVFKIVGPINGPDGSSLDIGEARVIAVAQGSESESRVLYKLTQLSMRHKDGRRSVLEVDGWVVGEDGIRGTKGNLKDKLGQVIAATATMGFAQAFADTVMKNSKSAFNFTGGNGITVNAGDIATSGVDGAHQAISKLTDAIISRYEKLVPVVEVIPGRKVALVFSAPTEVQVIEDDYMGENSD